MPLSSFLSYFAQIFFTRNPLFSLCFQETSNKTIIFRKIFLPFLKFFFPQKSRITARYYRVIIYKNYIYTAKIYILGLFLLYCFPKINFKVY
jgi:hypothetical protein